jgi:hypothetical protein
MLKVTGNSSAATALKQNTWVKTIINNLPNYIQPRKTVYRLDEIQKRIDPLLYKIGFKNITTRCFDGTAEVYVHRGDELVFKIGGTVRDDKNSLSKHAIPTLNVSFSFHLCPYWIRIQPLADAGKRSRERAYKQLAEVYDGDDFCPENVAMYRGKPVLIDW